MQESSMNPLKHVIPLAGFSPAAVKSLVEFLRQYYFVSNLIHLSGRISLRQEAGDRYVFAFSMQLDEGPPYAVSLSVWPDGVEIESPGQVTARNETIREFRRLADGVELMVRGFLRHSKNTKAYFLFSLPGKKEVEQPGGASEKPGRALLRRIMHGNAMNLFLFFLLVSFVFVIFLGDYALVMVIVLQSFALFYSDRLSLVMGNVRPTRDEPDVNLVSIQVTPEITRHFRRQGKAAVGDIRGYLQRAMAAGATEDEIRGAVKSLLERHNVAAAVDDVQITTRSVYPIVERAANKFGLPVPKVVISNTPADNASAMGISPTRATVTITAGALQDLGDEELESVVGHEIGHIKGRDPLILFGLTSVMYLGGFYLWVPLLIFLGFFYFILAFGLLFLVGKFLETRADTESANAIGNPEKLASALTNIGFRQLYYERYSAGAKVLDWLRFDPHPPTYFRVQRLYHMSTRGEKVRHTLLISTRDCITGFFRALGGEQ